MKNHFYYLLALFFIPLPYTLAQHVPLGQEKLVAHLDQELSGESAKRNLEFISTLHRMRGSEDYNEAIAFISSKLADYQLESIKVISKNPLKIDKK